MPQKIRINPFQRLVKKKSTLSVLKRNMRVSLTKDGNKWGEPSMLKQSNTRRSNGVAFIRNGRRATTSLNIILRIRKKNQSLSMKLSEIQSWLPSICIRIAKYDIPSFIISKSSLVKELETYRINVILLISTMI